MTYHNILGHNIPSGFVSETDPQKNLKEGLRDAGALPIIIAFTTRVFNEILASRNRDAQGDGSAGERLLEHSWALITPTEG